MHGLKDIRVVDFSTEVAGPYCTKLLADAGADVIKVESSEGDPLRGWSASGADLRGEDSALFRFLNHSKRSVVGQPGDPDIGALVSGADLVVESFDPCPTDALAWTERFPGLVTLSISPFGRTGPWAGRPWTEFTIQAESGSIGVRGLPGREPFQAGGRITEWVGGTFAAVGALAAVYRARRTGYGEHVDFSLLEVMNLAASNFMDLFFSLLGRPEVQGSPQSVETPSIEPTADGYVGFCTNTAQQFSDFLLLIERPDLRDQKDLALIGGRMARLEEWGAIVHDYTTRHTTAEIVEKATLLRIPVSPVNDGDRVRSHEQLVARGVFGPDPTGSFEQPRAPYKIDGVAPPAPRPAPGLGEHSGHIQPRTRAVASSNSPIELPLRGLRIVDLTAWWAGPSATHMLACLGADVIHVESIQRPDGMRMMGGAFYGQEGWWEKSPFFLAANSNKRGVTLNLSDPRGVDLAKKLIASADAVVENFTPRVLENFGLTWDVIHELNSQTILVRMPAFGLDGPWRDNTGFAQTMEQMTGMAWLTGHRDDQPRIQRGPCDPLSGMHAAFSLLIALEERATTGVGSHVECTMVEGALNAAAEQVLEFTAYGSLLERNGNRGPEAAPQGLYACSGHEPASQPRWLALSVATDEQWESLKTWLGRPDWAESRELDRLQGRRARHDAIDAELGRRFAELDLDALVEALVAAGIPAAPVIDPRTTHEHPQLIARGFYDEPQHPIVGRHKTPTLPFRYASVEHWLRAPAPTLGQHTREVLNELGLSEAELLSLEREGIIGEVPANL